MNKETKFKVGDKAHKPKGYKFPCTIVGVFETTTLAYKTEEAALKVIEDYKNKDVIEEGNKVKSTTYKMID